MFEQKRCGKNVKFDPLFIRPCFSIKLNRSVINFDFAWHITFHALCVFSSQYTTYVIQQKIEKKKIQSNEHMF